MAEKENMTFNYSSLIKQAITDFDSVFASLVDKKVSYSDGTALSIASHRDTNLIKTSDYAGLISSQLFRVEGLTNEQIKETVIKNKSTGNDEVTHTIAKKEDTETGAVSTITVNIKEAGYYTSAATLTTELETISLVVNPQNVPLSGTKYIKEVNIGTGKLISKVEVAKGGVDSIWTASDVYEDTSSYTSSFTVTSDKVAGIQTDETKLGERDHYAINVSAAVTRSGKLTVKPTKNVTEGYVTDEDVELGQFEKEFDGNITFVENSGKTTLYIPKGEIEIDKTDVSSVKNTITSTGTNKVTLVDANTEGAYEITATVDAIAVKGNINGGYVESTAEGTPATLDSIQVNAGKAYIKAGSYDAALSIANPTITVSDTNVISGTTTEGSYSVSVTTKGDVTGTVTEGYVKNGTYKTSIDSTKTVEIKKGAITFNPSATIATVDAGSISGSTDTDAYKITVTPKIDISDYSFTEGYIKAASISDGTITETPTTISIAHGKAEVANGLSVLFVNGDTGAGTGDDTANHEKAVEIFSSTVPQNRDYYTIISSAERNQFKAGYIKSADEVVIGETVTKYLPKADLTIAEAEDGNLVINVQAGYLPSGLLSTSDLTESTISNASLTVMADEDSSNIFMTTATTGAYKLSLTKGSITTAGYISDKVGSISGEFYVRAGSVDASTSISELSASKIAKSTTETGKYKITVAGTVATTVAGPEIGGYVTPEDLTINGEKASNNTAVEAPISKDISINAAVIGLDTNGLGLEIDASSIETVTDASKGYEITPKISDNGVVKVSATTQGYISDEVHEVSVTDGTIAADKRASTYIKAGTGVVDEFTFTNSIVATSDLAQEVEGDYTVTVGGDVTVSGAVDTGYYSDENKNIEETGTITGTGLTIAHGKVSSTVSASLDLSATTGTGSTNAGQSIKFLEDSAPETTAYVEVVADVKSITNTLTVDKIGYVKNGDVTKATELSNKDSVKVSKKIALVNLGTAQVDEETVYTMTVGQSKVTLDEAATYTGAKFDQTKDKYSSYATQVSLSADAMGSSVIAEMQALAARLNGSYEHN